MAQRHLTIAGMAGSFRVGFRDVVNQSMSFEAISPGTITVQRAPGGHEYHVQSSADNFRVTIDMVTPDDMTELVYWDDCTAYGWWQLDGYDKTDFSPGETVASATAAASQTAKAGASKRARKA